MLSLAALFVLAGFVLGHGGLDVVDFRARSGFVEDLAFAALIVILFRDGLEVEGEMLQRALAPAAAQARAGDAADDDDRRGGGAPAGRPLAGPSRSCSARCSPRPTRC